MPVRILTAETFGESKESIGYKGHPGTGKTSYLLSWPTPMKIAYFDTNIKTAREAIKGGVDAEIFIFDTAKEFEDEFVRKVRLREYEAETIGVDTFSAMAGLLTTEIAGLGENMDRQKWGKVLTRLRSIAYDLTQSAIHIDGKPSYNIVFTYHLTDVMKGEVLQRISPKIQGAFKDELEAFIDTVLLCSSEISSTVINNKAVPSKKFLCHSVPPDRYTTCKGGGLPPTLSGDYATLVAEWEKSKGEISV